MTPQKLIATLIVTLMMLNLLSPFSVLAEVPASCQKIGVNSAAHYAQGDEFYQKAASFGMGWTIEIADYNQEVNQGNPTVAGINRALANKLTPIIRIGVGSDSGGFFDPNKYALFLKKVAGQVNGTFYAVAGPNEPEYEHWLGNYNVGDQRTPNYDPATGIPKLGQLLADYMNAVINSGLDQNKVRLLSPSLSVTAWSTVPIIRAMKSAGANFSALAGFSGTSYSGALGPTDIRTQIGKINAELPSVPIVFTEFQDGAANLTTLKADIDVVKADSTVTAALLFNAFNTNSGWNQFALTDAELAQVLGPECVNLTELNKIVRPTPRASMRPCTTEDNPEFHPLRPYPGEPCDPLIPRSDPYANSYNKALIPQPQQDWPTQLDKDYQMRNSVAFACGNSLTPSSPRIFDQGLGKEMSYDTDGNGTNDCTRSGNHVTCILKQNYDLTLDMTDSNIPILGNTQTSGLTDAQKMTEYLSWYLNGTVQQSEQNPNPSISRLVNFSGPLQKLLPFDLKNFDRSELVKGPVGEPLPKGQYHNYIVGCQKALGVSYFIDVFRKFFESVTVNLSQLPGFLLTSGKVAVGLGELIISTPQIASQLGSAIKSIQTSDYLEAYNHLKSAAGAVPDDLLQNIAKLAEYMSGYFGRLGELIETISLDVAVSCSSGSSTTRRLEDFTKEYYPEGNLPPNPDDYASFKDYWEKYNNWRGLTNLPLLGAVDLGINPFVNESVWAQLFQNIPFSSLEDTTGEVVISVSQSYKYGQQDKDVVDSGKPIKLIIKRNATP